MGGAPLQYPLPAHTDYRSAQRKNRCNGGGYELHQGYRATQHLDG